MHRHVVQRNAHSARDQRLGEIVAVFVDLYDELSIDMLLAVAWKRHVRAVCELLTVGCGDLLAALYKNIENTIF